MTEKQYNHAWSEAFNYSDKDAFTSDLALSSLFLDPASDEFSLDMQLIRKLESIYTAATCPASDFIAMIGSQTHVANVTFTNLRTVQRWCADNNIPQNIRYLMARAFLI